MARQPGDKAPDFTLLDQHGDKVRLRDVVKNGGALVFFYPGV